jgi:hypothetical protein
MQFSEPPIICSLFVQNILLSTLFWNTASLYSSLSVRAKVSHPYKTTLRIKYTSPEFCGGLRGKENTLSE